ncbi:methyltransferase [Shewanella sp.]|uniref:methyltransferase n=1 Tax=Shewanella sp. TaxID=50422 RepID=UPI003561ED9F
MTTQFSALFPGLDNPLILKRYPDSSDANLQAWDAADEHLLKHLDESGMLPRRWLVINDSFGALTCALRARHGDTPIDFAADGRTAHLGALENLQSNSLCQQEIHFHDCSQLQSLGNDAAILMKLPKNLNFFADTLSQLSQTLRAGQQVLIGAKAKHINQSLLTLIGKNLGEANASLAWKKTRVIVVTADGKPRPLSKPNRWPVPELGLILENHSNVFAANKLDIGARLMLDNLPVGDFSQVIDLGCGNGVLGLQTARLYPNANVHFVDESAMAVASAMANWALNKLNPDLGKFHWDDCLSHLDAGISADLVLCNPPFHQGEAITDHIAWQMFNDAKRSLKPGGLLHIVGNRHLGYHVKLKRLFGNCKTIASNGKFVILQSVA